jgi:hypothetical protein
MMKRWFVYPILVLMGFGLFDYFFLQLVTPRLNVHLLGNAQSPQREASTPREKDVSNEILELRKRHHLRPLTTAESGTRIRDVAAATYGFGTCDGQTVSATRAAGPSLEIQKHRDGIAYFVGYASEDHIERYLTRQKNFHVFVSQVPKGKASLLFEIPIEFVSQCILRSGGDGAVFDLFVTAIPELQSFYQHVMRHPEQLA